MIRAAAAVEAEQPPSKKLLRKAGNIITLSPYLIVFPMGKQQPENWCKLLRCCVGSDTERKCRHRRACLLDEPSRDRSRYPPFWLPVF
jgi:hypothetical protein